jgi:hypothetical protein
MNIIYETTKERGATILMPSSMVDSMNPYGNTLALALAGNEVLKPNGAGVQTMHILRMPGPRLEAQGARTGTRICAVAMH